MCDILLNTLWGKNTSGDRLVIFCETGQKAAETVGEHLISNGLSGAWRQQQQSDNSNPFQIMLFNTQMYDFYSNFKWPEELTCPARASLRQSFILWSISRFPNLFIILQSQPSCEAKVADPAIQVGPSILIQGVFFTGPPPYFLGGGPVRKKTPCRTS